MFLRIFRPLTARVVSTTSFPSAFRFPLPIPTTRRFATSTTETAAPAISGFDSGSGSGSPDASRSSSSPSPSPSLSSSFSSQSEPPSEPPSPYATSPPPPPTPQNISVSSSPDTASTNTAPNPKLGLPYFVSRNRMDNFGVYQRRRRGGTLKLTLLKRGEGNLAALKHDLARSLQLDDSELYINNVTNHVVVKGFKRDEVLHFLRAMGF